MQMDAVWLLKNYRYLLSRQKFLQTLIPALASQSIADEEIIESITYLREGMPGGSEVHRTVKRVQNLEFAPPPKAENHENSARLLRQC